MKSNRIGAIWFEFPMVSRKCATTVKNCMVMVSINSAQNFHFKLGLASFLGLTFTIVIIIKTKNLSWPNFWRNVLWTCIHFLYDCENNENQKWRKLCPFDERQSSMLCHNFALPDSLATKRKRGRPLNVAEGLNRWKLFAFYSITTICSLMMHVCMYGVDNTPFVP